MLYFKNEKKQEAGKVWHKMIWWILQAPKLGYVMRRLPGRFILRSPKISSCAYFAPQGPGIFWDACPDAWEQKSSPVLPASQEPRGFSGPTGLKGAPRMDLASRAPKSCAQIVRPNRTPKPPAQKSCKSHGCCANCLVSRLKIFGV